MYISPTHSITPYHTYLKSTGCKQGLGTFINRAGLVFHSTSESFSWYFLTATVCSTVANQMHFFPQWPLNNIKAHKHRL